MKVAAENSDSALACATMTQKFLTCDLLTAQAHEKEGFKWWAQRLGRVFAMHNETRIDHFRGFAGQHPTANGCTCCSAPANMHWSLVTPELRC